MDLPQGGSLERQLVFEDTLVAITNTGVSFYDSLTLEQKTYFLLQTVVSVAKISFIGYLIVTSSKLYFFELSKKLIEIRTGQYIDAINSIKNIVIATSTGLELWPGTTLLMPDAIPDKTLSIVGLKGLSGYKSLFFSFYTDSAVYTIPEEYVMSLDLAYEAEIAYGAKELILSPEFSETVSEYGIAKPYFGDNMEACTDPVIEDRRCKLPTPGYGLQFGKAAYGPYEEGSPLILQSKPFEANVEQLERIQGNQLGRQRNLYEGTGANIASKEDLEIANPNCDIIIFPEEPAAYNCVELIPRIYPYEFWAIDRVTREKVWPSNYVGGVVNKLVKSFVSKDLVALTGLSNSSAEFSDFSVQPPIITNTAVSGPTYTADYEFLQIAETDFLLIDYFEHGTYTLQILSYSIDFEEKTITRGVDNQFYLGKDFNSAWAEALGNGWKISARESDGNNWVYSYFHLTYDRPRKAPTDVRFVLLDKCLVIVSQDGLSISWVNGRHLVTTPLADYTAVLDIAILHLSDNLEKVILIYAGDIMEFYEYAYSV